MIERPVVIVSNRGPTSFAFDAERRPVVTRAGGGLASALGPLLGNSITWIAAAMSNADRAATDAGLVPAGIELVSIREDTYDLAYNAVANETLWFVNHGMAPAPMSPASWDDAWTAYEQYNAAFADVVVRHAPAGAVVLVQDHHLYLVAQQVRHARGDLALIHFSHTPFAEPDELTLPADSCEMLLRAMATHDACGFHSARWANAYALTSTSRNVERAPTFISPLAPVADNIRTQANSPSTDAELSALEIDVGNSQVVARVDRIDPTKNILRGFAAFELLLDNHPELVGSVVFAAYVYPSRDKLALYQALRDDIIATAEAINTRYGTAIWQPVRLDTTDNLAGAMAAYRRYDVLLVNPTRDGLNLVAMEGPIVNQRCGRVVLSENAGAHDVLGDHVLTVNPFDVEATAEMLHEALAMGSEEAENRAESLRSMIAARSPMDWLADQLAAAADHPHTQRHI